MKKYIILITLSIGAIAAIYFVSTDHKNNIPPLLNRQGPISTTSEWVNTKKAIEGLQAQIRQNTENYKAKWMLALAYMQEARITGEHPYYYPAALELLEDVLDGTKETEDLHQQAIMAKASVMLSLHHFKEALEIGEEAAKTNSSSPELYGILCDANVELGHYDKAIEAGDKMVSIKPDLRSYSRISYLREIHGDLNGAIEAMKLAASAGFPGLEQTAWTRVTLGKLYEKKGDLDNAKMQYTIALNETPHYAFAVAGLAHIEASKKNYAEALKLYEKAAAIIPEFSFTEEMANVYEMEGKKEKSHEVATSVIGMLEEDAEAGHFVDLEMANLYSKLLNDQDKALDYANNEYEKRPDNIDVNKCLAMVYYKKNKLSEAKQYLKVANKTNRQDPELMCLSGLINYKTGNKPAGLKLIKASFDMNPFQHEDLTVEAKNCFLLLFH